MSKLLEAVNTLLVSIGEEQVVDLTEPSALMAKSTLDFVLAELPYTDADFTLDFESLPPPVYSYVVVKGARKFQASAVASEVLHAFALEDELNAKRLLIRKKMIPVDIAEEVMEELSSILVYADKIPKALKDNLALIKLQALLFAKPEEYVLSPEAVAGELLDFKRNLILTRDVPLEIVKKVRDHYFARYGFTGVIPVNINIESDITEMLKFMASYEFQKAILTPEQYVITNEEKMQDELDFRLAVIANKLYPEELFVIVEQEFIGTYGITQSDFTPPMRDYILNQVMFRLQSILIPNIEQRPLTVDDMDNSEATLLARLIVPRELYNRVITEVKMELAIADDVAEDALPEAVKVYAKYKSAMLHQPTVIRYPTKYIIAPTDLVKAKAIARQSLPTLSLMDSKSVSRIMDRDESPEAVEGNTTTKHRLVV